MPTFLASRARLRRPHRLVRPLARLLAGLLLLLAGAGCSEDPVGPEEPAGPETISVRITDPVASAELSGTATIEATLGGDATPVRVEFYANGQEIGSRSTAPWSIEWDTVPVGDRTVTLQAKAYGMDDAVDVSPTVSVSIRNGLTMTFYNGTPTSVTLTPSGQSTRTIASGGSATIRYSTNPGTVTYNASTKGKYGRRLEWKSKSVATTGRTSASVSLSIGSGFFYLSGRNSSGRTMSSMKVNYKRSNEVDVKPFSLGNTTTGLGYFPGSGSVRIAIWAKYRFGDLGEVKWDFTQQVSGSRVQFRLVGRGEAAPSVEADGPDLSGDAAGKASAPADAVVHHPNADADVEA